MERVVKRNKGMRIFAGNKGVSMVEVMIALVVLLIVFMGVAQTALLSIDSNVRNVVRDEAVTVAAQRMSEAKNLPFNNILTDSTAFPGDAACPNFPNGTAFPATGVVVTRSVRSIDAVLCTNRTVVPLDVDTKTVTINLGWFWKGEGFTHSISSIVRRPLPL